MKRNILVFTALIILLSLLCSCGGEVAPTSVQLNAADLAGKWETIEKPENTSELKNKLQSNGFFAEELELMDLSRICAVKVLTLDFDTESSGSYSYTYDKDATFVHLTAFFEDFISECYNNLSSLSEYYGKDNVKDISDLESFKAFYRGMFECETHGELIDKLCSLVFNTQLYTVSADKGTFTVNDDMIKMSSIPEEQYVNLDETTALPDPEYIGIKLDGDTLTVSYRSGTEVYTKQG